MRWGAGMSADRPATRFFTQEWNTLMRGYDQQKVTIVMLAQADAFTALVSELLSVERWGRSTGPIPIRWISFKSGRVYKLAEPGLKVRSFIVFNGIGSREASMSDFDHTYDRPEAPSVQGAGALGGPSVQKNVLDYIPGPGDPFKAYTADAPRQWDGGVRQALQKDLNQTRRALEHQLSIVHDRISNVEYVLKTHIAQRERLRQLLSDLS